jgi:DUF4097 and DUF4098 domain-containing protein YvlB
MRTILKTLGTTALLVAAMGSAAAAQQAINERLSTSSGGSVEVINISGSVRVTGWDRDEIQVTGTLGRGTERLDITPNGNHVEIRVVLPRETRGNVQGSELEVRIPARKDLIVRTVSASVEASDLSALVQAKSVSGTVRVSGAARQVIAGSTSGNVDVNASRATMIQASTVSGNIQLRGQASENASAESVSGSVNVAVNTPEVQAKSVSGRVEVQGAARKLTASTVSGRLALGAGEMEYGALKTVSGDIELNGRVAREATLSIETHSGDVELRVPRDTGADFEVRTMSGAINNEFGPVAQRVGRYGPGRELRFTNGRGGARVMVKTFSGDVTIRAR